MKKVILAAVMLCLGASLTLAQKRSDVNDPKAPVLRDIDDVRTKGDITFTPNLANAVDPADVGEADSFGKNAKFLGTATGGFIYLFYSCDPTILETEGGIILGPQDKCLAVPANGTPAQAQFNDIGRINLPKQSVENVVYMISNHSLTYSLNNGNPNPALGSVSYSPSVTIESEALNDPAAIDPNTGLPMNGSYTTTGLGSKSFSRLYQPGSFENMSESYTRANTGGLSRQFFQALGLPNSVVNKLFKKPMTLRLNVRITARLVSFGQISFSTRLLGN